MSWTRPFVDAAVEDLEGATRAAKLAAARLGLPSPRLLRVGMNALFAAGGTILRVGRPSADPAAACALARVLDMRGIRVALPASGTVVRVGALSVTAWRRVDPSGDAIDWHAVGRLVRAVHELEPEALPAAYPLPFASVLPWWRFDRLLAELGDEIDAAARDGLARAVERHRGWEAMRLADCVVCHGDVHPGNVMMTDAGPLLLDWDLLCLAPPGWDHAFLLTLAERWGGSAAVYPAFATGYGRSLADEASARRFAELRNVAATLMCLRAARADPSACAEAERRLRHWRGEIDAPMWQAR